MGKQPPAAPLADRIARYERMKAKREQNPPMTYEEIGASEDPPLTKERVRQILAQRPRRVGPPIGPERIGMLRSKLAYWTGQAESREAAGFDATYARGRVEALSREIAALDVTT